MDINHLIQREGEERLRAAEAASDTARAAHAALADLFHDRADFRRRTVLVENGIGPAPRPPAL